MKRIAFLFAFIFTICFSNAQSVKIMLVTGGHSYDTLQFFQMFDSLEGIEYDHFEQPQANAKLVKDLAGDYDVLVFYDMWKKISETEKETYLKLTAAGKPFLFMHHSIASYQQWPEFEKILGGKYFEKNKTFPEELWSNFEHDVWVNSEVDTPSPVTKGLKKMRFLDEIYGNVRISNDVIPLVKTKHPNSMEILAWENKYGKSTVVYLQPGHDHHTYAEPDFKKLVSQSIKYLAKSN